MTTWVKRLIIANIAVHVMVMAAPWLYNVLAFRPALVFARPWTLVTYMFVHAPGLGHLFFNMLSLFFLGPRVEYRLGSRDFLILYFASGMMGAVLSFVFSPYAPIVGASAAVFGVMYGFAHYWPREPLYIWGVLPIQARFLVAILAGLSIYSGYMGGGRIAHFAHLGGFVGGWIYLHLRDRRERRRRGARPAVTPLERMTGQIRREAEEWRRIPLDRLHEINRAEVERILRKLDEQGPLSITAEERAFMNRMVG